MHCMVDFGQCSAAKGFGLWKCMIMYNELELNTTLASSIFGVSRDTGVSGEHRQALYLVRYSPILPSCAIKILLLEDPLLGSDILLALLSSLTTRLPSPPSLVGNRLPLP